MILLLYYWRVFALRGRGSGTEDYGRVDWLGSAGCGQADGRATYSVVGARRRRKSRWRGREGGNRSVLVSVFRHVLVANAGLVCKPGGAGCDFAFAADRV